MPSPSGRAPAREVAAAGAVVLGPHRQVLLVHRPKYDDWSFPKGKLDPGEDALTAAVREVREETGVRVRLGLPLSGQRYPVAAGVKSVRYWLGRAVGDHDVRRYPANEEIDAVRWVEAHRAGRLLSYARDVATLEQSATLPRKTRTLVVLRHALAQSRRDYRGPDDRRRPLLLAGRRQAQHLVPMLGAYGVDRVLTSSSARCAETVTPFAHAAHRTVRRLDALSEEDATAARVTRLVRDLVEDLADAPGRQATAVLCTHRPVLPWVFGALGLSDPHLEKAEMLVVHLHQRTVVGCERHRPG